MKVKMDDKLFWAVKTMLNAKALRKEIAEYFGISVCTVDRVQASESFDEYKQILAAMAAKNRERKAGKTPSAPAPEPEPVKAPEGGKMVEIGRQNAAYINNRLFELLKEQNDLLKLISNKLVYIVEQLT